VPERDRMAHDVNQNPEQIARDRIDGHLRVAGWHVQHKDALDFNRLCPLRRPAAHRCRRGQAESWGDKLTTVEEQSEGYANAKLKWISNLKPLPFVYESTGWVTRFTNGRDPKPRSPEIFTFHRPETLKAWTLLQRSFRSGIVALPPFDPAGLRECQVNAIVSLEVSLKADKPRVLVQMARPAPARPSPQSRRSTAC